MLGATQADAFGAKLARNFRIAWRVSIGAYSQPAKLVSPEHQLVELRPQSWLNSRHLAQEDTAGGTVDGNPLTFGDHRSINAELLLTVVNFYGVGAADAGLAHTTCDHRRMAGHSSARSDDS